MSAPRQPGFDRLRPRSPREGTEAAQRAPEPAVSQRPDTEGKRALFSAAVQPPSLGSVTISCSRCGEHTVVGLGRALRLAIPSVHLPFLRPAPWSYLRCPACGRLAWVDVTIHL